MFGSGVLEVAIGLMFIYLVLSLVCSALNERICAAMRLRASTLAQAIDHMIGDGELRAKLYEHPLIDALAPARGSGRPAQPRAPSYIPSHLFSLALLDLVDSAGSRVNPGTASLVRGSGSNKTGKASVDTATEKEDSDFSAPRFTAGAASMPVAAGDEDPVGSRIKELLSAVEQSPLLQANPKVQHALQTFVVEAEGDTEKIRNNVEGWFNESMERASGWYKRKIQSVILVLALVVSVLCNADTIMIVNVLEHQPTLRDQIAAAAETAAQTAATSNPAAQPAATPGSAGQHSIGQPTGASLASPSIDEIRTMDNVLGWSQDPVDPRHVPASRLGWLSKVVGLLLTTVAVSLGAPFWFDVLGKIVNLRQEGRNPLEAPKK